MITLAEIASKLGTTEATVSNALNGKGRMTQETREKICKVAVEMGYTKHLSLSKNFRQILVVLECITSYNNEIIEGLTALSFKTDIFLNLVNLDVFQYKLGRNPSPERLKTLFARLLNNIPYQPSGLIYISQYPRKVAGLFDNIDIPIVSIRLQDSGANIEIDFDNQQGAYQAVSHLYDTGKRTIATISGPVDSYSSSERMIGYQRALIDHGLKFDPRLIWSTEWDVESGICMMERMLEFSKAPDAVFAQNDSLAYGAILAAKKAKMKISEDLAVIGFDGDIKYIYTDPKISTVRPRYQELGQVAFERMYALLRGEKLVERKVLLPCDLIIREST